MNSPSTPNYLNRYVKKNICTKLIFHISARQKEALAIHSSFLITSQNYFHSLHRNTGFILLYMPLFPHNAFKRRNLLSNFYQLFLPTKSNNGNSDMLPKVKLFFRSDNFSNKENSRKTEWILCTFTSKIFYSSL